MSFDVRVERGAAVVPPVSAVAGVRIDCDGLVEPVTVAVSQGSHLAAMYALMGCQLVDVVRLGERLDMWVDDEGIYRQPVNRVATAVAAAFGFTFQPYFGTVLLIGGADDAGELVSISVGQRRQLAQLLAGVFDAVVRLS